MGVQVVRALPMEACKVSFACRAALCLAKFHPLEPSLAIAGVAPSPPAECVLQRPLLLDDVPLGVSVTEHIVAAALAADILDPLVAHRVASREYGGSRATKTSSAGRLVQRPPARFGLRWGMACTARSCGLCRPLCKYRGAPGVYGQATHPQPGPLSGTRP